MAQFTSLTQLVGLLRAQGLLLLLLLVALAAAAYALDLYQQLPDTRAARSSAVRGLDGTRAELQRLESGQRLAAVQQELETLQREPPVGRFASRAEAEALGQALFDYVGSQALSLVYFTRDDASPVTLAETEYPAITYSLEVRGPQRTLVELLSVAQAPHTALTQELEMTGAEEPGGPWMLTLQTTVVYD